AISPVAVSNAQGLYKILPSNAPWLKSKPFNKAFACAVVIATPTFRDPRTEVVSKFLICVICFVIRATTRLSEAVRAIGRNESRENFPAEAEVPNSKLFSRVRTKAG